MKAEATVDRETLRRNIVAQANDLLDKKAEAEYCVDVGRYGHERLDSFLRSVISLCDPAPEVDAVQDRIWRAVAARGYLDGWSNPQLAARQVWKLLEEVIEVLANYIPKMPYEPEKGPAYEAMLAAWHEIGRELYHFGNTWKPHVAIRAIFLALGPAARGLFDGGNCGEVGPEAAAEMLHEVDDVIVVCSILQIALRRIVATDETVLPSAFLSAMFKAEADVPRGLRGEEKDE